MGNEVSGAGCPVRTELAVTARGVADAVGEALPGADPAMIAAALRAAAGAVRSGAGQGGGLASWPAADLPDAVAGNLNERSVSDGAEPVVVKWSGTGAAARGSFYNGFGGWTDGEHGDILGCSKRARFSVAEGIGAGVVGADSAEAYYPGGGQWYYDVIGDGVRVDVKYGWDHGGGRLGVPPAPTGGYDPAMVQEICPVELEYVRGRHGYLPDGTLWALTWALPSRVFRVPVAKYARMIKPDGRSRGRSLVSRRALEPYRVR